MSFIAYLYQVKASIKKFFFSNAPVPPESGNSKYAQEANTEQQYNIKLKCKIAAREVKYLGKFKHWPIARAKQEIEKTSLVYLDVSRTKRTTLIHNNIDKDTDKVIRVFDKTALSHKGKQEAP